MNTKLNTQLIIGDNLFIMEKKPSYVKDSTRDLTKLKQILNSELKKRNDKLIKALVDSLNKRASLVVKI